MTWWVRFIKYSMSLSVKPVVAISGRTVITILPGLRTCSLSLRKAWYELKTTGKIGTWPWIATWKAPFLNSWISPVLRRVPEKICANYFTTILIASTNLPEKSKAWYSSFWVLLLLSSSQFYSHHETFCRWKLIHKAKQPVRTFRQTKSRALLWLSPFASRAKSLKRKKRQNCSWG